MELIDVIVDSQIMLARVVSPPVDGIYRVQFLEESKEENIYSFADKIQEVTELEISGFYDTDNMEKAGYVENGDGTYSPEDEEYVPSTEEESEYESLTDEDQDEDD